MQDAVRIYVNRHHVEQKLSYSALLFPFWSPKIKQSTPFGSAIWQQYSFDRRYIELSDTPEQADFVMLAHNYWLIQKKNPDLLANVVREAERLGKPVLIDAYGDSDTAIPIPRSCVLRTSQYRFKLQPNEIIMPAYVEDVLERYCQGTVQLRQKQDTPSVGFTGWADGPFADSWRKSLKTLLFRSLGLFKKQYAAFVPGVTLRKYALERLQAAPQVRGNFIVRSSYSGHKKTLQGDVQEIRQQFVTNLLESDYALNVKGNGNYSQRFYETLSLGRIPLFVDTECVLPLESSIDYRECCVFVDYNKLARIGEMLSEFHQQLEPERFVSMQKRAREIFEKFLRVDGFTKHLARNLHRMSQELSA